MAKATKEFEWRMQGMLAAHKIVKEGGLEALDKEIRMRNFLKIDLWAKKGDVEQMEATLSQHIYHSIVSTFLFTVHDIFGFGKKRLHNLKRCFDKNIGNIFNLDYLGNHFVRFEDYARYLNEEYDFDFDINRVAVLQDLQDNRNNEYGKCDLQVVIARLKDAGFNDAAEWLEKKLS